MRESACHIFTHVSRAHVRRTAHTKRKLRMCTFTSSYRLPLHKSHAVLRRAHVAQLARESLGNIHKSVVDSLYGNLKKRVLQPYVVEVWFFYRPSANELAQMHVCTALVSYIPSFLA